MAELDHPNILKFFGSSKKGKIVYLFLEYLSGGDLYHYVNNNGLLAERYPRRMFRKIVKAVDYCHFMNVVHR